MNGKFKAKRELIDLLLYGDNENKERDFEVEFKELLKSITDLNSQPYQTDSNVHNPDNYKFNSPEFFAYFILGSVLVLPYTKIMEELNIESIYVRPVKGNSEKIEAVDLCFIVNKDGKKTAKILAFTVGSSQKKVPTPIGMAVYDNKNNIDQHLAKILQDNGLDQEEIKIGEFKVSVSVGDRIDVRNKKRVISEFKSHRGYSNAQEFQKIEKINNDIYDIDEEFASLEKMTLKEKQDLSVKMIDKISSIFNLNVATFELSKSRTTYQAFAFGAMMMNFKIRSKLSCFINSILGKDYLDLIFTVDHRSIKGATPVVVKFREGEGQDIIDKMKGKGYDIAPLQLKPMIGKRILVGVSFLENQPIKSEEVTVSQQENFFSQNYNSGLNFETNKGTIESFIKDIYYSIVDFIPSDQNEPAFDQKYKNYFSRLILGQLLASNLNKDIKKWIFVPDDKSSITKVVRFALMTGVEKKRAIVFNIIEDSDQLSENILPPGIIEECLVINIQINPKNAKYGFKSDLQEEKYFQELTVEEISASSSLGRSGDRWNPISNSINLQTLSKEEKDSQKRQNEVELSIISKLGKVINIADSFINNELDFQAITQGIFTGIQNIVPLTEVNYSPDGRPDLALHHTNSEVPLIVVEEKFFSGNDATEGLDKLQRAVKQIEKSKQYKAFTDAHKVIRLAMQFNKHLEKKLSYQFAGAGDVERSTESDNSIMERLFQYIKEDQYIDLKREKIEGCINLKKDKQTLLHAAVSKNRERIVDYLLEAKHVNVDTHNKDGLTPLYIAVDKGFIEIAKKLLKKGVDLNIEDNNGKIPLMVAVDHKNIDMATTLLDAGADANFINKNGTPILHYAIKSKNYSMVKLFLSRGACFDIWGEGSTSVALASRITSDSDIDKLLSNIRSAFRDVIHEKSVSNILERFKKEEVQIVLNVIDVRHNTLLHYAAQSGHENVVRELIKAGADVSVIGEDKSTPLHQAAERGYNNIVVKLIEEKAQINAADEDMNTPLHQAARNNHKSVVETLLSQGAITSIKDLYGYDPLRWAVIEDYQDVAELLIKNKADINVVYDDGLTPLGLAGEGGLENMAMLLIKNGAYIQPNWQAHYFKAQDRAKHLIFTAVRLFEIINSDNPYEGIVKQYDNLQQKMKYEDEKIKILFSAYDDKGQTLLHYAAEKGNEKVIKFLIDKGVDVNIKDKDGNTALHVAAEKDYIDVVRLLLKKGAHFDALNKKDDIPLGPSSSEVQGLLRDISDLFGHTKDGSYKKANSVLQDLSTENVRTILNVRDNKGKMPLHYVAESNNKKIVELFINKGAYFDVQDSQGKIPMDLAPENSGAYTLLQNINNLFVATENGNQEDFSNMIERLKSQAINLNIFNNKGKTPLHYAAQNNHKEITIKLIEDKVGIDIKDDEGRTPMDFVSENSEIKQLFQNINNIFRNVKNSNYENTREILKDLSAKDIETIFIAHNSEGKTCFQHALEEKHNEMAKLLIDKGVDVNYIFNNGEVPLYTVAENGNLDAVALLIDKGAGINGKCKNGNTALHVAAEKDHIDIAELLLKHGAEFYAKNNKGKIPLGFASESSKTYKLLKSINDLFNIAKNNDNQKAAEDILNDLSHKQVKIVLNLSDEKGNTCFLYAVKHGHSNVLKLFVARGADLNATNNNGETASYLAVKEGGKDVLELLIEYDIFYYKYDDGSTALHVATEVNNQGALKLLIEKKASIDNFDINAKDNNGNTALHIAAERKYTNIAKLLISKGASVDVNNNNDKTPLDLAHDGSKTHSLLQSIYGLFNAAKNDDSSLIKTTLRELGTEEKFLVSNARDNEGRTILHHAAELGYERSILMLIGNGASVNAKDNQGKTPLDLAPENSKAYKLLEVVEKIFDVVESGNIFEIGELEPEERSIVANIRDKEGRTILHYVAEKGHREPTLALIKYVSSFDAKDNHGKTPLDLAIEGSEAHSLLKIVKDIFDAVESGNIFEIGGLQPEERSIVSNVRDDKGKTPLHHAAEKGHGEPTLTLIKYGASFDTKDNHGKTPLDLAPENSKAYKLLKIVKDIFDTVKTDNVLSITPALKELEPDEEHTVLNAHDEKGKIPLHYAAEKGHKKSVMMLIGNGASVNAKDNQGKIPLDLAIEGSEAKVLLEVVKDIFNAAKVGNAHLILTKLIYLKPEERSCIVNAHDNEGRTPLHYAAQFSDEKSVVILINNGASVDIMDYQNKTPLDFALDGSEVYVLLNNIITLFSALRNKDDAGVKTVMKAFKFNNNLGVAVKARDSNGMTYLHYIIHMSNNDDMEMVELAIKNKADIDAKDQYGHTPLYAAVFRENVDIAKFLLDKGADILSINNEGNTILHAAAKSGHEEIVSLLMEKDPTLANAKNNDGLTPLELFKALFITKGMSKEERKRYQQIIDILSNQKVSAKASSACLPKKSKKGRGNKKNKREIRMRRDAGGSKCLLGEDGEVDKEKTGIEINEENFAESEIDNEKLKVYQEDLNNRLAAAIAQSDENAQNLIKEEQGQLNKLMIEVQQAQAIRDFHILSREVDEKLLPALRNNDDISPESLRYFEQVIKINLLRIVLPLIRNEKFKGFLLNNPEKFGQDQGLLDNILTEIKEAISNEYEEKEKLSYENFENIENKLNKQVSGVAREIEHLANQDVGKTDLSNYVFKSMGLNLVLLEDISDISSNLQNKICYETLVSLGALIHDHKNHIDAYHNGHKHNSHMDSLKSKIENSELLSIAHDLYYLHKSEGNVDQSRLHSSIIWDKINSYGNVNSEYALNDLYNQLSVEEMENNFNKENIKGFSDELETYEKEVITIHSSQILLYSNAAMQMKIKDNTKKNIVIYDIEDIKNPSNFRIDEKNLVITLKLGSEEYIVTGKLEGERTKFYLNVDGYKTKIGGLISSFTTEEKNNIHNKLLQLQNMVELLEQRESFHEISDIDMSDKDHDNAINKIKQDLLAKGVREETFNQLNEQLKSMNKEVYAKYVDEVEKSLTKNDIGFDQGKFNSAKIKGAKGGKFMSFLAIYDLLDSTADLKGLGGSPLNTIFGINGVLDAMDDVRESLSTQYRRSDGKIKTKLSRHGLGKITSKIPADIRKSFVRMINNPIVQGITFATIAWQFGHSIDQIIKGENVELNAYFATSSGIKLASMSMKPIGIAFKVFGAPARALRILSVASKFLGRLSTVTMVADVAMTTVMEGIAAEKYVSEIASKVPLLYSEKFSLFIEKTLLLKILCHLNPECLVLYYQTEANSEKYENDIAIRHYLNSLKERLILLLNQEQGVGAVVVGIDSLIIKYHEKIASTGERYKDNDMAQKFEVCQLQKNYTNVLHYGERQKDLFTLNIDKTLSLTSHLLDATEEIKDGCERATGGSNRLYSDCIKTRTRIYTPNLSLKYLPYLNSTEYERNKIRIVKVPQKLDQSTRCQPVNDIRYEDTYGLLGKDFKCNDGKVYEKCKQVTTFSDGSLILTKEARSGDSILYFSGPPKLTAAANYPAVMYTPKKDRVWYIGSENNETIFIIDHHMSGTLIGGAEKKNTVIMNIKSKDVTVNLYDGIIRYNRNNSIKLSNVYNYISHSTAQQSITTDCKTRYVSAGGGSRGNTVRQGNTNCQDEDHEVRVVHKNDVHHRGSKQTIFVVNRDSNNATITVDNNFNTNKNSANIIRLEGLGIERLRIKEAEGYYNLTLLTDGGQATSVKVVDYLKNLVIYTEGNQTIFVQDKYLPDFLRDMLYQKLNHSGEYVDDRILENSKTKSKAVILKEIDNTEATPWTARNIADKSNNLGISSQIVVTKHREKELIEQAVIHDTYSNDIHVDLFASGDFKFGYPFSYIESIKTKDENTTTFSFLDGSRVHLNRNGHNIIGYVFNEIRSISDIIADGDYQDIVNELNTTISMKFGDEVVIIGTKEDDILHNNPNYKTHLVGSGGKDRYVIDMNLNDFSIPEVTIYDPNGPIVDMYDLKKKLGIDFTLQRWFDRNDDIIFDSSINDKGFSRIHIKRCKRRNVNNLVPFSEDMSNVSVTCGFNQKLLYITRENILSRLDSDNWDPLRDLKNLFNNGRADLSIQDDNGNTPLHFACKNCNYIVAKYLIEEKDARINAKNKDGKTPLDLANECKQSEEKGRVIDVIRTAQSGLDSQLLDAISNNDLAKVRRLVSRRASLNVEDKDGDTPLHLAALYGKSDVVGYLIGKGADINAKNRVNNAPLHRGAQNGNLEVVKCLIEHGADINARGYDNDIPLHIASRRSNLNIIKYLIGYGADVNARNNNGETPFNLIKEYMGGDIEKDLKKIHQLYLDKQLLVAAENDNLNRVKDLHIRGANVNARDNYDNTPLHLVALYGHKEIVKHLIINRANTNAKNKDGKTPLDLAQERGYSDVEKILKEIQEAHPIRHRRHHVGRYRHSHHSVEEAKTSEARSSGARPSLWINEGIVWMKESITNIYKTTKDVINGLFSKDKTSQKMESAARFEDIKTWNKENNEPFSENVESQNVVGFYDAVLGKLNKEDLKRVEDLCEEIKANFEPYKDSDIYTCLRNVAELIKDKCNIDNDYLNNLCANKLLESMKEQTDNVKRYNMQKQGEYIRNLYDQDGNIILLTYLLGWYSKIKSKDEEDIHDEIREVAYKVLKEVKACETINQYSISIPTGISEDDIYTTALGKMIISGNIQKNQIVETLFCSLENLIEIKLKEDKNKEESSKIKEFMETYKTNVIIALGMVADDIISYCNSKLSEEEKYYYKELYTIVEQDNLLEEAQSTCDHVLPNVSYCLSNISLYGNVRDDFNLININKPASSLNNISVMSNITQARSFLNV